jgi:hypothetical protein
VGDEQEMNDEGLGFPWVWDEELGAHRVEEAAGVFWTEGSNPQPLEGRFYEPPPGVFTD